RTLSGAPTDTYPPYQAMTRRPFEPLAHALAVMLLGVGLPISTNAELRFATLVSVAAGQVPSSFPLLSSENERVTVTACPMVVDATKQSGLSFSQTLYSVTFP